MKWIHAHSLSLTIIAIWIVAMVASVLMYEEDFASWLSERAGGHADDAFGAMLLILLTKWLYERGSEESKGE